MIDNEKGGTPPRYHIVRTSYKSYELWVADRVAIFDNRADLQHWVQLLQEHRAP